MSESKFQKKLIEKYSKQGWYCIKLIQTNKNGIPDLLLLKDGEIPMFIECKAKGGKLSKLQEYRHKEIERFTGIKPIVLTEDS